jgi:hypothetical protein
VSRIDTTLRIIVRMSRREKLITKAMRRGIMLSRK